MAERIFISYAHEDRHLVRAVREALTKDATDVVFLDIDPLDIDPAAVEPGQNIRRMIQDRIRSANKVVIIASDHSANSAWVNYEAGMAAALDKPIVVMGMKGSGKTAFLLQGLANVQRIEIENPELRVN
ncbi:MAG: toll/interleukin-1 receptor domain-containing protein [Pyrinomonadaceae bacterium]